MNRCQFLKLFFAALASAPLSACVDALDANAPSRPSPARQPVSPAGPQSGDSPPDTAAPAPTSSPTPLPGSAAAAWDVAIIGAGIAGLRAGQILQQNKWRVVVLEARNRLGGRIWTDYTTGTPLDLGASWIHGARGNPITAIANQRSLRLIATDYDNAQRFDFNGAPLTNDLDRHTNALLERYLNWARQRARDQNNDLSLQTALEAVLREKPLGARDLRLLNYALNTTVEHEYAADASQLSAWHFDEQQEFDGEDLIFAQGYQAIVDVAGQGLEVRLNHIAQRISADEAGVTIGMSQGSLRARAALITAPLGVLQRGSIAFEPPLPPDKQQALARVGMGLLNKCYLRFPTVFWNDATLLGYVSERKGEWAEWLNLHALLGTPILLGFNAGAYARHLETLTDPQIVAAAMQSLRRMYGNGIPDPSDYRVTRWAQDPFAFGSYSFLGVNATPQDYDILAQPAHRRLFFAGEHTERNYPSTAHGAYLSGERAAAEISELLKAQ